MSALMHCIYASVATVPLNTAELVDILLVARANNKHRGITGILLYTEGSFFQILEGAPEDVAATYAKTAEDHLFTRVTDIISEPIAKRAFSDWTMGFSDLTHAEQAAIGGLNDFFQEGTCCTGLRAGRSQKLLRAFAAGRWRTKLRHNLKKIPG
ncbi:BLUF domain-containing protein [Terriglobus saanensis]|uniref:BLUF domain protein n=1 Tax=Terriglobus saanensis (strain ATCC BAA-1853 / DSM 23119 / SP1PR4) TaxID=401053 RepID=E8UXB9_TERSS|nr:BLUF domain-containing protein [Terriglobus saanensis]ADV84143.1 BLUF domain protein [Terriglobus saanensis SP1PR4]